MRDRSQGIMISLLIHLLLFSVMIYASDISGPEAGDIMMDIMIVSEAAGEDGPYQSETRKMIPPPEPASLPEIKEEAIPEMPYLSDEPDAESREPAHEITEESLDSPVMEPGYEDTGQLAMYDDKGPAEEDASAGKSDRMAAIYVEDHFEYISRIINKKISYPYVARKMSLEGKVVVSFIISTDGSVRDVKIEESSSYSMLDKNALETINKCTPFPSPPVEARLLVPVNYELY